MKIVFALVIFSLTLHSCENKTIVKNQRDEMQDTIKKATVKSDEKQITGKNPKVFTDTFEFEYYNDNYMRLHAKI
ncbi:hypothetical protein [Flavobacterium algicola]|uniref:hypothetical protein n=1 Tax=Flavobacterium algicola TaxID=556529 RepID=UPI001EFDBA5E|nr:hypothetical protein [Flavobacterium algicola]MCG9791208.1 hypothetical protein [Flavobacterium algicola]